MIYEVKFIDSVRFMLDTLSVFLMILLQESLNINIKIVQSSVCSIWKKIVKLNTKIVSYPEYAEGKEKIVLNMQKVKTEGQKNPRYFSSYSVISSY